MDGAQIRRYVEDLLDDSPITSEKVRRDIRELLEVGEEGLAFDTLCTWLYEDDLSINEAYYRRLQAVSGLMGAGEIVDQIRDLVRSP